VSQAGYARHLCVSVDIERYGGRDDRRQEDIQRDLLRLLTGAARSAGLDRSAWHTQGEGDSELTLIPLDGAEPRVVDDYVRKLDHELGRYNSDRSDPARIRLRVAIHQGVGYPAANGFAGAGVVTVSRLRDCEPVRTALAAEPTANLALIVSDSVYQDVIRSGHTTYRADEFRQVAVAIKELSTSAWVRVPAPGSPLAINQRASTGPAGTVHQADRDVRIGQSYTFHGPVDARYGIIGPVVGASDGDG
jgi:hypothetical protein